jgi:hypothetical protein
MPSTYSNIKIFRGSLEQIEEKADLGVIENMAIYLATDTNQIFVGGLEPNRLYEYSGDKNNIISEINRIEAKINTFSVLPSSLTSSVINLGDREISLNKRVTKNENDIANLGTNIDDVITQKVDSLTSSVLNSSLLELNSKLDLTDSLLRNNYYTKPEVISSINERINGQSATLATKNYVNDQITNFNDFKSIRTINTLSAESLASTVIAEDNGVFRVIIGGDDGMYEMVIKNTNNIIRISHDGVLYNLTGDGSTENPYIWAEVLGAKIKAELVDFNDLDGSIRLKTSSNRVINANDIPNTVERKWNSLFPNNNGAVNVDGRNPLVEFDIGDNSIGIGKDSTAEALRSVSIGYNANIEPSAVDAIQLGTGSNNNRNTFQLWENTVFERFPVDVQNNEWETKLRPEVVTETFATITVSIPVVAWIENTAVINVTNLKTSSLVWVSPNEETYTKFVDYEVRAIAQGNGTITFKCLDTPDAVVKVNLIVKAMEYDN